MRVIAFLLVCLTTHSALAGVLFPTNEVPPSAGIYTAQITTPITFPGAGDVSLNTWTIKEHEQAPLVDPDNKRRKADMKWEFNSIDDNLFDIDMLFKRVPPPLYDKLLYVDPTTPLSKFLIPVPPGAIDFPAPILLHISGETPGTTTITPEGGNFRIDSFFDIFTEISLDGGTTWFPASDSIQMKLTDTAAPVPELGSFLTMGLVICCSLGAVRFCKRFGFKCF